MKRKRRIIFIICAIFAMGLIVFSMTRPRDYELQYHKDGYDITETYHKEGSYYQFILSYENMTFPMTMKNKYIGKKLNIESVDVLKEDDEVCILMSNKALGGYPVCRKNGTLIDYDLIENGDDDFFKRDELVKTKDEYRGIELAVKDERNYFIWNYKGYLFLNDKTKEELKLLEKESYYNNLAYSVDEYLITPNYAQDYAFTEVYVINMKTGKSSLWKMDTEISYNSYYLGDQDGFIYLVDRKNKAEYKIDARHKRIERIDKDGVGQVYEHSWHEMSMTKLASDDFFFVTNSVFEYVIEDDKLWLLVKNEKESCQVSNRKIDKIVAVFDDSVFYLVGDELYSYSLQYGENLILKYSELNFNNLNSIFIY